MNGLLLIDKPVGLTSHDVVHRIRKRGKFGKVGHTGTLDPFATGVLPICLERATRLAGYFLLEDKTYEATLRLGERTDTLDCEGAVVETAAVPMLDEEFIRSIFARHVGVIEQTPPMYSAVKVKGRSLHEYAREGVEVDRKSRQVTIHSLELLGWEPPLLRFRVFCSKGTYVRVLAETLAQALGTVGHLSALRRTRSGDFRIEAAQSLETVLQAIEAGTLAELVQPLVSLLPELPAIELDDRLAERVRHGNTLLERELRRLPPVPRGLLRLVHQGELLALAEGAWTSDAAIPHAIQPRVVMATEGAAG